MIGQRGGVERVRLSSLTLCELLRMKKMDDFLRVLECVIMYFSVAGVRSVRMLLVFSDDSRQ